MKLFIEITSAKSVVDAYDKYSREHLFEMSCQSGKDIVNHSRLLSIHFLYSFYYRSLKACLMGSYTVEDLSQESGLTLATTITKCRSKEVAKKNQSQMVAWDQESKVIAVFQNHTHQDNKEDQGCGGAQHKGGHIHCLAYDKLKLVQFTIRWAILPVFAGANRSFTSRHQAMTSCMMHPSTNTIHLQPLQGDHIQLCSIAGDKVEPAPTITVQMATHSRTARSVTVLSDSGADISAAGQAIVGILGHRLDNLTPSEISPRAVNRACMKPLGKIATSHNPSTRKDLLIKMKSFQECHRHSFHIKLLKSWAYCPLVSTS